MIAVPSVSAVVGPGETFRPDDIAGLTLWLNDRSDRLLVSGLIDEWDDVRGNGPVFDAPSSLFRATPWAWVANGRPSVAFGATGDYLRNTSGSFNMGADNLYVFASARWGNLVQGGLISKAYYGNMAARWAILREASTNYVLAQFGLNDTPLVVSGGTPTADPAIYGLCLNRVDGDLSFRIDGAEVGSTSFTANQGSSYTNNESMKLGYYATNQPSNWGMDGQLGEVLVYQRATALTAADISNIERYLAGRWGVAIS